MNYSCCTILIRVLRNETGQEGCPDNKFNEFQWKRTKVRQIRWCEEGSVIFIAPCLDNFVVKTLTVLHYEWSGLRNLGKLS